MNDNVGNSSSENKVDKRNRAEITYKDISAENKLVLKEMIDNVGKTQVTSLIQDYYGLTRRGAYYWVQRLIQEDANELQKQIYDDVAKEEIKGNNERAKRQRRRQELGTRPIKRLVNVIQSSIEGNVDGEDNTDEDEKSSKEAGIEATSMYTKGASTLVDSEGNVKLQWIKEATDEKLRLEAMSNAIEKFIENITKPKLWEEDMADWNSSRFTNEDLLSKYPMADMHIGLRTYANEVGEEWGLEQSKEIYTKGIQMVMDGTPNSEVGLILDLGDMFHVADSTGKTRGHGHQLDVDGNLEDIYEAAIFIATTMIETALKKHRYVIFRKTIGNHDGDTSIALNVFLKRYYENNNRVQIAGNSDLFWWYKWGKTLHFSTHGHTVKQKDLPEIVAHDCKDIWSDCDYIYADTGHIHHKQVLESRSMVCESHNTAVPGDSFNYGSGYRSGRLLKSITYSKLDGEVARNTVPIKKIKRELRN